MSLKSFTDEQLIDELISRNGVSDAPRKTGWGAGMKFCTVGIGKDEIATISVHQDGIDFLALKDRKVQSPAKRGSLPLKVIKDAVAAVKNRRMSECASKVLRGGGNSKAAKTARGSALSVR